MSEAFKKSILLLKGNYSNILFIIFLYSLISLLDIFSLSVLTKFLSLAIGKNEFQENPINYFLSGGLLSVGGLLVFIFFFKFLISIYTVYSVSNFSMRMQKYFTNIMLRSYLNMDYENFVEGNSSDYMFSAYKLAEQFCQGPMKLILQGIGSVLVGLCLMAYVAFFNFNIFIAMTGAAIIFMSSFFYFVKKRITQNGIAYQKSGVKLSQYISEALVGYKEIKILGAQEYFSNKVSVMVENYAKSYSRLSIYSIMPRYIIEFIFSISILIVVFSGNNGSNELIVNGLAIFVFMGIRMQPVVNNIMSYMVEMRYHSPAIIKLYNNCVNIMLTDITNIVKKNSNFKFNKLAYENINFSYGNSGDKKIIHNFSFEINRGDVIQISGKSGSGKTTLIGILMGFLKPSSGQILLNSDIVEHSKVKDFFYYLPQDTFIIDDSLRRNIAFGIDDELISDARVLEAIQKAQLMTFFGGLSNGLDSYLGDRGSLLSGGERQRIAIARFFYSNREIVILDESFSALDPETADTIISQISSDFAGKTIIFITHNDSNNFICNKKISINNGLISKEYLV